MLTLANTITKSVKQVLRDLGLDLDAQAKNGTTAAMEASFNGHVESVKLLHEMKSDLNVRDERGATVLFWAARNGHTETLKVMSRQ